MAIAVECPSCNSKFQAADKMIGKRVKCPKCSKPISVGCTKPEAPTPGSSYYTRVAIGLILAVSFLLLLLVLLPGCGKVKVKIVNDGDFELNVNIRYLEFLQQTREGVAFRLTDETINTTLSPGQETSVWLKKATIDLTFGTPETPDKTSLIDGSFAIVTTKEPATWTFKRSDSGWDLDDQTRWEVPAFLWALVIVGIAAAAISVLLRQRLKDAFFPRRIRKEEKVGVACPACGRQFYALIAEDTAECPDCRTSLQVRKRS